MFTLSPLKSALCALVLVGASATLGACGTEFTYDSNSFFPEDYRSSYTKHTKHDCTASPTHGGDHVRIWLSDEIKPAYEGDAEAPEGAVALKEQFSDEDCEDLTSITVFKKKSASETGWEWQRIQEDGSVEFTVDKNFCSDCHTSCAGGGLCGK